MKREEWAQITWAAGVLGLGEPRASLTDIKQTYRALAKQHHPDTRNKAETPHERMRDLNQAYRILRDYCESYRFPLTWEDTDESEDEQWWFDRFGEDPIWGKGKP